MFKEFIIIMSDSDYFEVLIEASMREDPSKSAPVQVY